MRAAQIILREFGGLEAVHRNRLKCLADVVAAVFTASHLALTQVGRALRGAKVKNAIKRVDRLLSNAHLHVELGLFYVQLVRRVLPKNDRPVLLIDWTDIGTQWAALVVTLVSHGRGLVLCSEVHARRKENDPRVESSMLQMLQKLLPTGCRPILVSDAGFRGPWLRKVIALGWDFVGRVRGRVSVRRVGTHSWASVKGLWRQATQRPTDLGRYALARYLPIEARLVCVRKHMTRAHKGLPKVGRRKKRAIRGAREPWILATSMHTAPASDLVGLYALRMRIEQTFRDEKCPKLGLGLDQVRTKKRKRIEVYLLLAALAHYIAFLVGLVAEHANLHWDFQANTCRDRRVLSLPRLGRELIRRGVHFPLPRLSMLNWDVATYPT